MKEASCFHENTLTSMKNEWDRKINSLQAALVEEEAQKANDLTELEHYEYLMKEALCYHENTLRSLKIDFNQDSAPSRNYNANVEIIGHTTESLQCRLVLLSIVFPFETRSALLTY